MRTTLAAAALMLSAFAASAAEINGPARVVDGDTIEIAATKIRLSGVDSPETAMSRRQRRPMGLRRQRPR